MLRNLLTSLWFIFFTALLPVHAAPTAAPHPSDEFWVINGVAPDPKSVRILIIGDGLVSGLGLPDEKQSIAGLLIDALGKRNPLYPRIVKSIATEGETSASVLARIKYITNLRPHLVILAVGMNDAAANTDPDIIHNNLGSALSEMQRVGIYTLMVGMQAHPKMGGYEYMASFNSIYPRLAEQFKLPFAPNITEPVANNTMLLQRDEIYPNAEGAKIIAEMLRRQYLEEMTVSLAKNISAQFREQILKAREEKREQFLRQKQKKTVITQ
jgi:acyl-CoA thioesterase-1